MRWFAADPVHEHVHPHAGASPGGERIGEALRDVARPVDKGLEGDAALGALDRLEHGGENFGAVAERLDEVAIENRRPEKLTHRALELRIGDAVTLRDPVPDLDLAADEVAGKNRDGCAHRGGDPDREKLRVRFFHGAAVGGEVGYSSRKPEELFAVQQVRCPDGAAAQVHSGMRKVPATDARGLHAFAVAIEKLQRDRGEISSPRCNRSR